MDVQISIGKIKDHGKQPVFACVLLHLVLRNADLCHGHHIVFVKYFPFQLSQEIFDPILQQYIRVYGSHAVGSICRKRLVLKDLRRFLEISDGIHAETGHSHLLPVKHHIDDFTPKLFTFPVEIRLLLGKAMEIKTIAVPDALPGAVAIVAAQVVGHLSVCLFNDKIVCILAIRVCHGLFKPFMLIGTVIDNQIHQHADPCLFRTLDQFFEIFICAERRINFHIIGDIISAVFHR